MALDVWHGVQQVSEVMAREVLSSIGATGISSLAFGQFLAARMCGPKQTPGFL
jgi:hypothetical protein